MSTMPTRVDGELYDAAKVVGGALSRSAAQQITHWARVGREFESAAGVSQRDVARVLAGRDSYDALEARAQALVRVEWEERIRAAREGLDLAAEFVAEGQDWVEADEAGAVIRRTVEP